MTAALVALALGSAAGDAHAADALRRWHALWPGVTSLAVEFDLETTDQAAGKTFRYAGRFRFLRTGAGPLADATLSRAGHPDEVYLLNGGRAYLLNPAKKTAQLHPVTGGDAVGFAARNFHPLALMTDAARSGAYRTGTMGANEHYTFLGFVPTAATRKVGVEFRSAVVAVLRVPGLGLPAGAPVTIKSAADPGSTVYTYQIKSWRVNAPDGPAAADFMPPEQREGWEVTDFGKLWPAPRK